MDPGLHITKLDAAISSRPVPEWNTLASGLASQSCTVTAVHDGDTLTALCSGVPQRIRISSIDAPESRQPYGPEARQFTTDLALQQTVAVLAEDYDRYDRMVARVVLPDGRDLGRELVRASLAWHYVKYSRDSELGAIQAAAREASARLWRDAVPEPPSVFRRAKRENATRSRRGDRRSERGLRVSRAQRW